MGDSYQVVAKHIKKRIKSKYYDIKIVEEKSLLYFDIGIGEKFVIFTLPVEPDFSFGSLVGFMSVEVFLEIIRRFVEINPPKGHRVRFIVFKEYPMLFEHLTSLGTERVLLLVNVKELGLGNEKVVINCLSGEVITKIHRIIKQNGLSLGMVRVENLTFPDKVGGLEILQFSSFPNPYKTKMPKDIYDVKRRDFGVALAILLTSSVIRT